MPSGITKNRRPAKSASKGLHSGKRTAADEPLPSIETHSNRSSPDVGPSFLKGPRQPSIPDEPYRSPSSSGAREWTSAKWEGTPVSQIPGFSDSEEERDWKLKVLQFYDKEDPAYAARYRKKNAKLFGLDLSSTESSVYEADEAEEETSEEEEEEEEEEERGTPAFDPKKTPLARLNIKELLEITGLTLNFLINARGSSIDLTNAETVRDALDANSDLWDDKTMDWGTPIEQAREHAAEMVERLFDMPVRDFMRLAHDVIRFKEELDARGVHIIGHE